MSNKKYDPLDLAFNMVDDPESSIWESYQVDLPDSPQLDHITEFALNAYKTIMEGLIHVDPRGHAKQLEIAERYLNQAKDAMDKKQKNVLAMLKTQQVKPGKNGESPTEKSTSDGLTRQELLAIQKENRMKSV